MSETESDGDEITVKRKGVRCATIEEGDANAHEEGDDDEPKTSAEGVNESEPINPSLWRQTTWAMLNVITHRIHPERRDKHTHVSHQQQTHEVEAEAQRAQEQRLVQRVSSELRKFIQHSSGDPLHVPELGGEEKQQKSLHGGGSYPRQYRSDAQRAISLTRVSTPSMKSMRKNKMDQNTEPGSKARASG